MAKDKKEKNKDSTVVRILGLKVVEKDRQRLIQGEIDGKIFWLERNKIKENDSDPDYFLVSDKKITLQAK